MKLPLLSHRVELSLFPLSTSELLTSLNRSVSIFSDLLLHVYKHKDVLLRLLVFFFNIKMGPCHSFFLSLFLSLSPFLSLQFAYSKEQLGNRSLIL